MNRFKYLRRRGVIASRLYRVSISHSLGEMRQFLRGQPRGPQSVALVIGCQRSGTTLMTQILGRDPTAKVYPEHSALSSRDRVDNLRLDPLETVRARIERSRYPLVVLKPLVESQNTPALLDAIPRSRAIWMYRHYADVVASNLTHFGLGNGVRNLRRVAEKSPGNWRAEGVSQETAALVRQHFTDTISPWDAAALFWVVRNRIFFDIGLEAREEIRICRYESLVAEPTRVVRELYEFIARPYPGDDIVRQVQSSSIGKGEDVRLSNAVQDLCEELLTQLEAAHEGRISCASFS